MEFPDARRSSQGNGAWRQKMQAADGATGLCEMIRSARSTELRGGKGAEESMNFLNSLNPKRPRGQEVIPSAPNHVTSIGTAWSGQFSPQAALSSETGTSNHQSSYHLQDKLVPEMRGPRQTWSAQSSGVMILRGRGEGQ